MILFFIVAGLSKKQLFVIKSCCRSSVISWRFWVADTNSGSGLGCEFNRTGGTVVFLMMHLDGCVNQAS